MSQAFLSDAQAQQEVEKNFKFNFIVNALDGASFWFGFSLIAPTIIMPLYISHFTANPLIIGLIPFINTSGYLLPQLFTSNFVERAAIKKFFPVRLGFFLERIPIFLMAPSAYFLAGSHPTLALIAFLLLYSWHCGGAGLIIVGWQDMIAKIIPVDRRGRFFGITNFIGNSTGILGALAVTFVLEKFTFPQGYVLSFTAAAILILFSWIFLSLTREPAVKSTKPPVSQMAYMRSLPKVIRDDQNFLMYLVSQIFFSLSGMASGFLIVYTAKNWNMPDAQAGGFVIAMQIGQSISNLFFGFLADRKGHKMSLEIALLLAILSLALAILAPTPAWFFPVFFLRGAVMAGTFISGISIVMEFTGHEDRATYIGLANTIPGVAGSIAPLIGGWMAGAVSYQWMFVLSAVIATLSWVLLHFAVKEPRDRIKAPPLPVASLPVDETAQSS
jgi:MFS family permease